jgi:hypothetical protein
MLLGGDAYGVQASITGGDAYGVQASITGGTYEQLGVFRPCSKASNAKTTTFLTYERRF